MNRIGISKAICFDKVNFGSVGVLPHSVLKVFQEVATEHADILGVGHKELVKKNLHWVVLRIKFEVLSQPQPNQDLTIETYCSAQNFFEFDRDFLIRDKRGNLLIKGTSKWCLFDTKERHITSLAKLGEILCEIGEPIFENRFLKSESFEPEFLPDYSYKILPNDIDENNHTNNTVYAKMIIDILNLESQKIKFFQINFLKESFLGNRIDLYKKRVGKTLKILGKLCERELSFSVQVEFCE